MYSYLIAGGDTNTRAHFIESKITPQSELIHLKTEKSVLTIKQIQDLFSPLSITPRLPRIVWIEEANLLTIPAQNALLKMLEEPPDSTSFYLTLSSATSLLQTIRSRCQTINLSHNDLRPTIYDLSQLKQVMSLSPGDRLAFITKRDRSESLIWLTQIEQALSDKLHDPHLTRAGSHTLAKIARLACLAHLQLAGNCSVALTTQNFLLSLPKTK